MQERAQRLGTLDIARWLAAVAVVLFHCSMFLQHTPFGGVLKLGYHGVDFFFVLSGFVISNAHLKDLGHSERMFSYLKKRFLRIYPPYWAALMLALAWAYGHPYLQAFNFINVITNFFLIPKNSVDYPFVIPAWTLYYELLFYGFFALSIWVPRYLAYAGFLLWPATIYLFGVPLASGHFPMSFLLSKVILEFFFGVGSYLLYKRVGWPIGLVLIVTGTSMLGIAMLLDVAPKLLPPWAAVLPTEMHYGISSAAVISGLAVVETRLGSLRSRVTDYLGNITYGTYLVHYTFLVVLIGSGAFAQFNHYEPWLTCLGLAGACIVAGMLFYSLLERPAVAFFRYILRVDRWTHSRLNTEHATG